MDSYREFAIGLAHQAGEIMRKNFSLSQVEKEWKSDDTPVTATDKDINQLVITAVQKAYPEHDILGEEAQVLNGTSHVWVLDPVDGTIPFSHGIPTFVFSLALVVDGKPLLAVVHDPVLNRLVVAEKDQGTTMNNEPIRVSKATSLKNTLLSLDVGARVPLLRPTLIGRGALVTTCNSAVYSGMLVAQGSLVAEIFHHQNPWDGATVKLIVEEAGGKVTDLDGNEQRYDQQINGYLASNGQLHDQLLQMIKHERTKV